MGGKCGSIGSVGSDEFRVGDANDFVVMLVKLESNSQVWPNHCRILYDSRGEEEMIVDLEKFTLDQVHTILRCETNHQVLLLE